MTVYDEGCFSNEAAFQFVTDRNWALTASNAAPATPHPYNIPLFQSVSLQRTQVQASNSTS